MVGRSLSHTKHFQVSRVLAERIKYMSPGEQIPRVAELKEEFAASQATIMAALDRLRRRGLVERPLGRRRLVVAQRARPSVARVALIRPIWSSPDYDALVNAIYEEGHRERFEFHAYIFADLVALNLLQAIKEEDDAAILTGIVNPPEELVRAFNKTGRPLIFMRDKPEGVQGSHVWVDDRKIGVMATEHLLRLGHGRIAVMLSEPLNPSSSRRLAGWRQAMQTAGQKDCDSLIIDCSVHYGEDAIIGSYARLTKWLGEPRPKYTALFCLSWTGALAAMRAFREREIEIPRDISLITYGSEGAFSEFLNPPLTTVQTDVRKHALHSVRLVKEAITREDWKAERVIIEAEIVERMSTRRVGK